MGKPVWSVKDNRFSDWANDKQGALDQIRNSGSASIFTEYSPLKAVNAYMAGNEKPLEGDQNPYSNMSNVYDQLSKMYKQEYDAKQAGQPYQQPPTGAAMQELWKSFRQGVVPKK